MYKLISHKLGDLIINLFLSLFNSTKCGVVFFYVFSMPFHLPCRILLSFRFVASHVHRSCQFASYASFPPAPGTGLDHGKLGGAFLKRPASIVAKRKHGRPRCWQLWMTWENVEFWISPRVRPWEVDWIMTHSEDYTYVYNFFFSLGLSNMLISDLRVSNSNLRHFFYAARTCAQSNLSQDWAFGSTSLEPQPEPQPVFLQFVLSSSGNKNPGRGAALRLRSRGPGTSAGRIWISIDLCWKNGVRRMISAMNPQMAWISAAKHRIKMCARTWSSPLKPHLLRMRQGKATFHHFQFCRWDSLVWQ